MANVYELRRHLAHTTMFMSSERFYCTLPNINCKRSAHIRTRYAHSNFPDKEKKEKRKKIGRRSSEIASCRWCRPFHCLGNILSSQLFATFNNELFEIETTFVRTIPFVCSIVWNMNQTLCYSYTQCAFDPFISMSTIKDGNLNH